MASIKSYAVLTFLLLLAQGIFFSNLIFFFDFAAQLCNSADSAAAAFQGLEPPLHATRTATPLKSRAGVNSLNMTLLDSSLQGDGRLTGVRPRIWTPWPVDLKLPCLPVENKWWDTTVQRTSTRKGLFFVKEMKTGSSTIGGIVLRLARKLPKQYGYDFKQCSARLDHCPAGPRCMKYGKRIRDESYLFTFLREPSARLISQFFHFKVSRDKMEPSDSNIKNYYVKSLYAHDYYLQDLSLELYPPKLLSLVELPKYQQAFAEAIIRDYDFIGITERMDESLVVLQLLLHLNTSDILYVSAKSKGSFDDGAYHSICTYIVPSYTSPGMKQWFNSSQPWNRRSYGDQLLYHAANRSLDLTIDSLGRDLVQEKVKKFKQALALAQEKCSSNLKLPCSPDGVRAKLLAVNLFESDCLWLDSGCGYKCLDEISEEIDNMFPFL